MSDLCRLIWFAAVGLFRSQAALQAEIILLRHQLNVLRRKSPKRLGLNNIDRLLFVGIYRLAPQVLDAWRVAKRQRPRSTRRREASSDFNRKPSLSEACILVRRIARCLYSSFILPLIWYP